MFITVVARAAIKLYCMRVAVLLFIFCPDTMQFP